MFLLNYKQIIFTNKFNQIHQFLRINKLNLKRNNKNNKVKIN